MQYNRKNPYFAYLKDRYLLNKAGSTKKTYHISLKIDSNKIKFKPGDSIGVIPLYEPDLTTKIFNLLGVFNPTDDEIKTINSINISDPTKKLLEEIKLNLSNPSQLCDLEKILNDKASLKEYLNSNHVLQVLKTYPSNIKLSKFVTLLKPMLPRFYSIASSNLVNKDEIHLLVAENTYYLNEKLYYGVGSHYLCNLAKINDPIAIYVQTSKHFTLPNDFNAPIIMIGPGTGLAPFRAFLQERIEKKAFKNWLFFGERNKNYDFYYQSFLEKAKNKKQLKLDLAFSRDQNEKIYVQNLIKKNGKVFFDWIKANAHIYVCGDAKQMAKAVEKAILEIFQNYGKMSEIEAKDYLKALRKKQRYLMDVY